MLSPNLPADKNIDMVYFRLRQFHFGYEIVVGSLSYMFNIMVAYLSLTTKSNTMKQYCWIILMNVFGDLLYNTFNLVTMTVSKIKF